MKLIIDIPEGIFLACKHWLDEGVAQWAEAIIANGTPLPKGHGKLIDADALIFNADYNEPLISKLDFDNAPTIIEADKETENEQTTD